MQRYSKEETSLFEELRYGLFFGTVGFADRLKSRFLKEAHPELPQQIMLLKKHEISALIKMVTPLHLRCDTIALGEKAKTGKTTIIQRLTTDRLSRNFLISCDLFPS